MARQVWGSIPGPVIILINECAGFEPARVICKT